MNLDTFIKTVSPHSMTSIERITELFYCLENIRINNIDGDIVECGVWRGGNILGIIEYLHFFQIKNKRVWLYDTFGGMTTPEGIDVDYNNTPAAAQMYNPTILAKCELNEVKRTLSTSNFDATKLKFVVGDVSNTLTNSDNIPNQISLLRLDTDWYKSTKDELNFLYPKLNDNGILIVDDYGHWKGSKLAVDEFFADKNIMLEYIDYTGVKITKKLN
jgi:O-methyltransferase